MCITIEKTRHTYKKANLKDKTRAECTFCVSETRQKIIDENQTMFVIPNRVSYDLFEGLEIDEHMMIIPKRHIENMTDLTKDERRDFADMICKYEGKGYSFYGRGVGSIHRSVAHQHTHLLKMKPIKPRFYMYLRRPYLLFKL
jgi:diadenosine tetraphosphate (Ap4A) HIT family hydrolase